MYIYRRLWMCVFVLLLLLAFCDTSGFTEDFTLVFDFSLITPLVYRTHDRQVSLQPSKLYKNNGQPVELLFHPHLCNLITAAHLHLLLSH